MRPLPMHEVGSYQVLSDEARFSLEETMHIAMGHFGFSTWASGTANCELALEGIDLL